MIRLDGLTFLPLLYFSREEKRTIRYYYYFHSFVFPVNVSIVSKAYRVTPLNVPRHILLLLTQRIIYRCYKRTSNFIIFFICLYTVLCVKAWVRAWESVRNGHDFFLTGSLLIVEFSINSYSYSKFIDIYFIFPFCHSPSFSRCILLASSLCFFLLNFYKKLQTIYKYAYWNKMNKKNTSYTRKDF